MSTCRHCRGGRAELSTLQLSLLGFVVGVILGGLGALICYAGFEAGAAAALDALDTYAP
ncbi:MAG: hypothetical protein OXU35_09255 [Acidobacteriota bacterium]|nr:hypothetical protein [Acidobacteriota bacterium]